MTCSHELKCKLKTLNPSCTETAMQDPAEGTSDAPVFDVFYSEMLKKSPRIQHSVQLSLHQPLSNCIFFLEEQVQG